MSTAFQPPRASDAPLLLDSLISGVLPPGTKGMPLQSEGVTVAEVAHQNWNLLDGDVSLPAAVLLETNMKRNSATMSEFLGRYGLRLAPHGKTTMAPQLFQRQLEAGAWGFTAATPAHLALYLAVGVRRIIYANQLVDPGALSLIANRLADDPDLEVFCLVDSADTMRLLAEAMRATGKAAKVDVLIELGIPSGRTGVRTAAAAIELGKQVTAQWPELRLRGVEAFEGIVEYDQAGRAAVDALLDNLTTAMAALAPMVSSGRPIISVGGSAYFPRVVERLATETQCYEIVLRSGCYLIHDHGLYQAAQESDLCRGSAALAQPLLPALEVWGYVQSRPEPGRVLVTIGKRDISHDAGLPVPIKWSPRGTRNVLALDAQKARVTKLNDQHAYLELREDHPIKVGDRIAFGCSHPCTTFDKWRVVHIVEDDYRIIDSVATFF